MTEREPLTGEIARWSGATQADSEPTPIEEQSPLLTILPILRRNFLLIVGTTALATGAAFYMTNRMTPMYQARASIRVDEQPSQIAALRGVGIAGGRLATEVEMLRSRQLLSEVVDSVGLRLSITNPTGTLRTQVVPQARVADSALLGDRRVVSDGSGGFRLLGIHGEVLIPSFRYDELVSSGGVEFMLGSQARMYPELTLTVLPMETAVRRLDKEIDVQRRSRDAELIDLSVRHPDPQYARELADMHARVFIGGRQGSRQLEAQETVRFLNEQIGRVQEQLTQAEVDLRSFRQGRGIVNLAEEATSGVMRRSELMARRNQLEAERQAFSALLQRSGDGGGQPDAETYRRLLAFPTLVQSGIAGDIVASLAAAEERRSELTSRRTENDPDVILVESRIDELQGQIQSVVGTYFLGLADQIAAYDTLLVQSNARLGTIPAMEFRMVELEREARGTEAIYAMLQARLKEAEIAAAASDQSVRLVDPAVTSPEPVAPKPILNLALAVVSGAMLGLAGAFVREHTDRSLRTRRELLSVTGVPVFGIVPRLAPRKAIQGPFGRSLAPGKSVARRRSERGQRNWASPGDGSGAKVYDPEQLEVFAEAHSRLVTNLSFMAAHHRPKVIAVTSALPGDGKTTVSSNLALALARAGQRVLLIDADLRGGRLASVLKMARQHVGLAEVLAGELDRTDAIVNVEMSGSLTLHAIPAGRMGASAPSQLFTSQRAKDLIDWARSEYDAVIVDTPPVASVSDMAILVPVVDGVLLVARSGVTPRDALVFAMEQLGIVRAPVMGAVLNDVDLRRDASYDGAYQYYRSYGYGRSPG